MAIKSVKIIKENALIPIEIHSSYHKAIQNLVVNIIEKQEDPKQAIINAAEGKDITLEEATIKAMMTLLRTIELSAEKNGLLEDKEVDIPDETNEDPSEN